jgi:hypothetical protein
VSLPTATANTIKKGDNICTYSARKVGYTIKKVKQAYHYSDHSVIFLTDGGKLTLHPTATVDLPPRP